MTMPETSKQRSRRIEMDYYRQRDLLGNSKVILAIVGAILALAVGIGVFCSSGAANPGPLIAGHAAFESNCSECHQALTPIGADSVRNLSWLGIEETESVNHTFDACTACHHDSTDPIGDHYQAKMGADWSLRDKNCVLCHADHQGRDFNLTLVSDQRCVQCHQNLDQVCTNQAQTVQLAQDNQSITGFSSQHGDFVSLQQEDPGKVKFDHAQHLLPGQTGSGRDVIRLQDLEPEQRERYREAMERLRDQGGEFADLEINDDSLVQLDCFSCHQFGGAPDSQVSMSADAELGRYLQPISFDRHCSACHSLNLDGRTEKTMPVPHAATWTEMDQWIDAKLSALPATDQGGNPLGIGAVATAPADDVPLADAARAKVREALQTQCAKCHQEDLYLEDGMVSDAPILAQLNSSDPLIPSRWLKHGVYDHAAHRRVSCRHCHQAAYQGDSAAPPTDQSVVMISGIETCVDCHRPVGTATPAALLSGDQPNPVFGDQSLWASDRCTMCHRYHTTDDFPSLTLTTARPSE